MVFENPLPQENKVSLQERERRTKGKKNGQWALRRATPFDKAQDLRLAQDRQWAMGKGGNLISYLKSQRLSKI